LAQAGLRGAQVGRGHHRFGDQRVELRIAELPLPTGKGFRRGGGSHN
jgi:hypothetical protein